MEHVSFFALVDSVLDGGFVAVGKLEAKTIKKTEDICLIPGLLESVANGVARVRVNIYGNKSVEVNESLLLIVSEEESEIIGRMQRSGRDELAKAVERSRTRLRDTIIQIFEHHNKGGRNEVSIS